jgi:hypothetical protein
MTDYDQERFPAYQRGARNVRHAKIRDRRGRRTLVVKNEQIRGEIPFRLCCNRPALAI